MTARTTIDTSNYRKHTHGNPILRRLLDRFHHRLMAVVGELQPESFLDAGCGEGFVARQLLAEFPGMPVTGFDANADAVEVAASMNRQGDFLCASIEKIPFADNTFDVVGCFEVLEHLPQPELALAELLRVSSSAVVLSVPSEPYFCTANMLRGKNLSIRPIGSDPDHKNFWTFRGFDQFVTRQADVIWLDRSLPWTICAAVKRTSRH